MSFGTTARNYEIFKDNRELCVVLKGRVVLEDLGELKQSVLPRITSELEQVYIDLQPVDFVDSAGLGLLIGIKMTSKMNGAAIALMDPGKNVSDVLSISKMDGIFEVLKGADAAAVRDRLVKPENVQAIPNPAAHPAVEPFAGEGDSAMPHINADGTLQTDDSGEQVREAVEEHCRRAVESMRQGDYEKSIECYQGALQLDPDYLPALNNLAIVYEKQPAWHPLAIDTWNRVLAISRQRNDEKHVDRAERHLADLNQ